MNEKNSFHYTYSASQNKEVQSIRKKYLPASENKLELLKQLDNQVMMSGTMESIILGFLGCMFFGIGVCFVMHIIGNSAILGILFCMIGALGMGFALPVCRRLKNRKKAELAPRILALTDELMK